MLVCLFVWGAGRGGGCDSGGLNIRGLKFPGTIDKRNRQPRLFHIMIENNRHKRTWIAPLPIRKIKRLKTDKL